MNFSVAYRYIKSISIIECDPTILEKVSMLPANSVGQHGKIFVFIEIQRQGIILSLMCL